MLTGNQSEPFKAFSLSFTLTLIFLVGRSWVLALSSFHTEQTSHSREATRSLWAFASWILRPAAPEAVLTHFLQKHTIMERQKVCGSASIFLLSDAHLLNMMWDLKVLSYIYIICINDVKSCSLSGSVKTSLCTNCDCVKSLKVNYCLFWRKESHNFLLNIFQSTDESTTSSGQEELFFHTSKGKTSRSVWHVSSRRLTHQASFFQSFHPVKGMLLQHAALINYRSLSPEWVRVWLFSRSLQWTMQSEELLIFCSLCGITGVKFLKLQSGRRQPAPLKSFLFLSGFITVGGGKAL